MRLKYGKTCTVLGITRRTVNPVLWYAVGTLMPQAERWPEAVWVYEEFQLGIECMRDGARVGLRVNYGGIPS
jgi:hypothetical protein